MWHYFEKGHGKGPCDGIGGAVKRGAAQAAKHGVPMADAHQFHDWAMQHESGISFVMISRFEYNHTEADVTLIEKRLQPVSHTLSLHSIRSGQRTGDVEWWETSCNCVGCLARESSCEYHCVSVLKPPPKGRGKRRKQEGKLLTNCDMCTERVLCLCLQDVNDDLPLFISSSSEVVEADTEYVPVTEEHASDSEGETVVYLEAREERITLPGHPGEGEGDDEQTVVFDEETLIFSDPEDPEDREDPEDPDDPDDTGDPQPSTSTGGITRPRRKRH